MTPPHVLLYFEFRLEYVAHASSLIDNQRRRLNQPIRTVVTTAVLREKISRCLEEVSSRGQTLDVRKSNARSQRRDLRFTPSGCVRRRTTVPFLSGVPCNDPGKCTIHLRRRQRERRNYLRTLSRPHKRDLENNPKSDRTKNFIELCALSAACTVNMMWVHDACAPKETRASK